MRRYTGAALLIVAGALVWQHYGRGPPDAMGPASTAGSAATAPPVADRSATTPRLTAAQSGHLVSVEGRVERTLSDDRDGDRHQRFILRLASGQTLLVAHNIDLAPRVEDLRTGEMLRLRGEFVWNQQGGLLHWTHRDPSGRHEAGYIERGGRRFQ